MSSREKRSSSSDAAEGGGGSPDGKMRRILSELQGLVADLRTWIDLRLDLAILKLEDRVRELQNNVALALALAFFGLLAVLFGLTTLAVGLGWLLGHPFWGFLTVSVVLILIVVGLRAAEPELLPPPNLLESIRGEQADEGADRPDVAGGAAAEHGARSEAPAEEETA